MQRAGEGAKSRSARDDSTITVCLRRASGRHRCAHMIARPRLVTRVTAWRRSPADHRPTTCRSPADASAIPNDVRFAGETRPKAGQNRPVLFEATGLLRVARGAFVGILNDPMLSKLWRDLVELSKAVTG